MSDVSSIVQSSMEGMDMNQMSINLFSKHLLGPECRQRVKGHLASRTKTKIPNPGDVCPSPIRSLLSGSKQW